MDHSFAAAYLMRARTSMSAPFPSGKLSTTRVRRPISRLSRSIMSFVRMRLRRPSGNPGRVGRGPADPLPQAVGGGRQPPGLHLRGDGPGLVQRGFPGLHGRTRPSGPPTPIRGGWAASWRARRARSAPCTADTPPSAASSPPWRPVPRTGRRPRAARPWGRIRYGYWGDGDTLAVTGGQSIADVTPNCVARQ